MYSPLIVFLHTLLKGQCQKLISTRFFCQAVVPYKIRASQNNKIFPNFLTDIRKWLLRCVCGESIRNTAGSPESFLGFIGPDSSVECQWRGVTTPCCKITGESIRKTKGFEELNCQINCFCMLFPLKAVASVSNLKCLCHWGVRTPQIIGLWGIMTPRCMGHWGVMTPRCMGPWGIMTPWCIGHRGVCLNSPTFNSPMLVACEVNLRLEYLWEDF